jgi:hypothetical protein
MSLFSLIDRGLVKLSSSIVLILFLAAALAYAAIFGLFIPIFVWFWLSAFISGTIISGAAAYVLSFLILVGAFLYVLIRIPILLVVFVDLFTNILDLGNAIGDRINDFFSVATLNPLSIQYDLKKTRRKIIVSLTRPEQDPQEIEEAAHRQVRRALAKRDLTAFSILLEPISDIDATRDNITNPQRALLLDAAEAGATEFVAAVLDRGADANRADSYHGGVTALHLAAQNGHLGTVKLLIDRNANVDARDQCGDTPLCYAAMCHGGHPDVVEVLLNHGAEVNARDNKGRTILDRLNLDEPKEMKRFLVDLLKSRSGHEAI